MKICDTVNSKLYKKMTVLFCTATATVFMQAWNVFLNPNIRDLPVAVSGDAENRHGIILAKNEEAKKYNIKKQEKLYGRQRKNALNF